MLLTIIFIVGLILSILTIVKYNKHDSASEDRFYGGLVGLIIFGFFSVLAIALIIGKPCSVKNFNNDYQNVSCLVDDYVTCDSTEAFAFGTLSQQVFDINSKIKKHATYIKSPWVNWLYSKEIAGYPEISLSHDVGDCLADPD